MTGHTPDPAADLATLRESMCPNWPHPGITGCKWCAGAEERGYLAALYVQTGGIYYGLPNVEPWDEKADARLYDGPHPVVAHPPCARWCQLASVNEARWGTPIGKDGGTFTRRSRRSGVGVAFLSTPPTASRGTATNFRSLDEECGFAASTTRAGSQRFRSQRTATRHVNERGCT